MSEVRNNLRQTFELFESHFVVRRPKMRASSSLPRNCFPDIVLHDMKRWRVAIECKDDVKMQSLSQGLGQCLIYKQKVEHVVLCVPDWAYPIAFPDVCKEAAQSAGIHITTRSKVVDLVDRISPECRRVCEPDALESIFFGGLLDIFCAIPKKRRAKQVVEPQEAC